MRRKAILTKSLKKGIKTITGQVIRETFDKISLVVIDSKGSSSIKSFKKSDYAINIMVMED
ncbi:hypothetical protein D3C75_1062140 [compost metagenome]